MKHLIFWSLLFVASLLVGFYTSWLEGGIEGDVLWNVIPRIFGKALGMVLIPAIMAGFIVLVRKLLRRSTSNNFIFITVTIFWVILAWSHVNVVSYEANTDELSRVFIEPARRLG